MKLIFAFLLVAGIASAGSSKSQIKVKVRMNTSNTQSSTEYKLVADADNWTSKPITIKVVYAMIVQEKDGTTDARVQIRTVEIAKKSKLPVECSMFKYSPNEAKRWKIRAWGVYVFDDDDKIITQGFSSSKAVKPCHALYKAVD